jgi:hypothetical protein
LTTPCIYVRNRIADLIILLDKRHIKEIMGVKRKPDIIDIIEKKRLEWYSHVKRTPEERISKLIMQWIQEERSKRGRPRKTWMNHVGFSILIYSDTSANGDNLFRNHIR